jgi:hypothetical protein
LALPFQTRLAQTKPVLPLSNEQGSQVKHQGRRQCYHIKHKKIPYRPTRDFFYFPDTPNILTVFIRFAEHSSDRHMLPVGSHFYHKICQV